MKTFIELMVEKIEVQERKAKENEVEDFVYEPFDLGRVKDGASVVTMGGDPVRIISFDEDDEIRPIRAVVDLIVEGREMNTAHKLNGGHSIDGRPSGLDLVICPDPEKHREWIKKFKKSLANR